jgi:type II secretory pathway component GspD/PulD (secretin)
MNVNKRKGRFLAVAMITVAAQFGTAYAQNAPNVPNPQKVKKLEFLQDDAQDKFVSKMYTLQNIKSVDATPFVQGAVKRYNINSTVEALNYTEGKKQFLLVSTPPEFMPYVDDIIKNLDRVGGEPDKSGSVIDGTGIFRYAYLPKHRSTDTMVAALNAGVRDNSGYVWRDPVSNLIYWKDTPGRGQLILAWAKGFDRPVPQVELQFKVYELRDSELDDIGLDYLAWKNGPGLNIFQAGYESITYQTVEKLLSNMDKFSNFSYGGYFTAPQFDLSFVRLLSQKGRAKIASAGTLTVVNNYLGSYNVRISPQFQNIAKDANDRTAVVTGANADFALTVTRPIICFTSTGEKDQIYKGDAFDQTTYSSLTGTVQLAYTLNINNVVERNNRGTELTESNAIASALTFELQGEHLLGVFNQTQKVEQTIGIPFLSDIPYLKYLFGTTTSIDTDTKLYVTVSGRLVHPEDSYEKWTGKLLTETDFPAIEIFKEEDK